MSWVCSMQASYVTCDYSSMLTYICATAQAVPGFIGSGQEVALLAASWVDTESVDCFRGVLLAARLIGPEQITKYDQD